MLKKPYNPTIERQNEVILQAQVKAVVITLAIVMGIIIYARIANAILPQ